MAKPTRIDRYLTKRLAPELHRDESFVASIYLWPARGYEWYGESLTDPVRLARGVFAVRTSTRLHLFETELARWRPACHTYRHQAYDLEDVRFRFLDDALVIETRLGEHFRFRPRIKRPHTRTQAEFLAVARSASGL